MWICLNFTKQLTLYWTLFQWVVTSQGLPHSLCQLYTTAFLSFFSLSISIYCVSLFCLIFDKFLHSFFPRILSFSLSNYSLQALAVGSPVVTLPSDVLGGRFTLAMYKKMGIYPLRKSFTTNNNIGGGVPSAGASSSMGLKDNRKRGNGDEFYDSSHSDSNNGGGGGGFKTSPLVADLVALSPKDFVAKALRIAFAPQEEKLHLRKDITSSNHLLFEDEDAVRQWDALLTKAADG